MKKIITLAFLLFCISESHAQESYFKAGANINFTYMLRNSSFSSEVTYPPFPGLNLSYEKPFGKNFSITYNLDVTRQTVLYKRDQSYYHYISTKRVNTEISFSPEVRYYPIKNQGLFYYKNQGLFIHAGVNLLSYRIWNDGYQRGSYFSYPFNSKSSEIYFGLGIKYPLTSKTGIEMNVSTDLYEIMIISPWQPVRIGFKFYWLNEKANKKSEKQLLK